MPRPDFRSQAAERLAAERTGVTPALIDLLRPNPPSDVTTVLRIRLDLISPNPEQPRQHFDEESLAELASSIKEHGVFQPVLVRPRSSGRYQLVAGERRWRASKLAGLTEIPAIVEDIDDEAALEIAIIENLQREDISPLEEADMFERMTSEHGYSLRKLAQKLGKDKGYIENRLRLSGAPPEIRELVATRRDTLSHAYELLKVEDEKKRRKLAAQVASGELSLVKLRQRIEGRPVRTNEDVPPEAEPAADEETALDAIDEEAIADAEPFAGDEDAPGTRSVGIDEATEHLAMAVDELAAALVRDASLQSASVGERQSFAKYLTIAKIKLENAIAVVRTGEHRERTLGDEHEER